MSTRLTEWLSRLASISGDSRKALIRFAKEYGWDLQDFDEGFVRRSVPRVLKDILSPYEIAVVQRVWKSDFEQSEWRRGTFDFLSSPRAAVDISRTSACSSPARRRPPKHFTQGAESFWLDHPDLSRPAVRVQAEPYARRSRSLGAQVRQPPQMWPRHQQAPRFEYAAAPRQARDSSNRWHEAEPRVADRDFVVSYMGGFVEVAANDTYFVDRCGRVLVGWDGTVDPPRGMDGEPLIDIDDVQMLPRQVTRASSAGRHRPRSAGYGFPQGRRRPPVLSSERWSEAQARRAECDFVVRHGWEYIDVPQGDIYYVDHSGKVLVGWEGSVCPPCDQNGWPLVVDPDFPVRSPPTVSWDTATGYEPARPRLSSSFWEQARPQVSNRSFMVKYGDGEMRVPANQVYYIDNLGRVLVGWKGSFSPPYDIDGQPLV